MCLTNGRRPFSFVLPAHLKPLKMYIYNYIGDKSDAFLHTIRTAESEEPVVFAVYATLMASAFGKVRAFNVRSGGLHEICRLCDVTAVAASVS